MTVTMNTCEKKNHHQTNGSKVLINISNYPIAKIIRTDSRAVELKRLLDGYRHTTYGTVGITCQGNVVCDAFLNHILFLKDKLSFVQHEPYYSGANIGLSVLRLK